MTKIVLDRYIQENQAQFTKTRLRMERKWGPACRRRAAEEKAILLKLDRARWGQWIEDGRMQIVGQRKFRVKLPPLTPPS